jgi:hypothetical protein
VKAGILLVVVAEVIKLLQTKGFINSAGDFVNFDNIQNDVELAKGIEEILKNHGVLVPSRLDAILNILPLIITFIH